MAHHRTLLHLSLIVGLCIDSELIKYFFPFILVCLSFHRVALGLLYPVSRMNVGLVLWTPR